MSAIGAAKRVKKMIGLGAPPTPQETRNTLQRDGYASAERGRVEPTVQLNLRVPGHVKHCVRVLALRDRISQSDLVVRAIELYEEKHGRAPEL